MQTKDIDKKRAIDYLSKRSVPANSFVMHNEVYPELTWKMFNSVMKNLIRRGFVDGCTCGCSGDFVLTGIEYKLS